MAPSLGSIARAAIDQSAIPSGPLESGEGSAGVCSEAQDDGSDQVCRQPVVAPDAGFVTPGLSLFADPSFSTTTVFPDLPPEARSMQTIASTMSDLEFQAFLRKRLDEIRSHEFSSPEDEAVLEAARTLIGDRMTDLASPDVGSVDALISNIDSLSSSQITSLKSALLIHTREIRGIPSSDSDRLQELADRIDYDLETPGDESIHAVLNQTEKYLNQIDPYFFDPQGQLQYQLEQLIASIETIPFKPHDEGRLLAYFAKGDLQRAIGLLREKRFDEAQVLFENVVETRLPYIQEAQSERQNKELAKELAITIACFAVAEIAFLRLMRAGVWGARMLEAERIGILSPGGRLAMAGLRGGQGALTNALAGGMMGRSMTLRADGSSKDTIDYAFDVAMMALVHRGLSTASRAYDAWRLTSRVMSRETNRIALAAVKNLESPEGKILLRQMMDWEIAGMSASRRVAYEVGHLGVSIGTAQVWNNGSNVLQAGYETVRFNKDFDLSAALEKANSPEAILHTVGMTLGIKVTGTLTGRLFPQGKDPLLSEKRAAWNRPFVEVSKEVWGRIGRSANDFYNMDAETRTLVKDYIRIGDLAAAGDPRWVRVRHCLTVALAGSEQGKSVSPSPEPRRPVELPSQTSQKEDGGLVVWGGNAPAWARSVLTASSVATRSPSSLVANFFPDVSSDTNGDLTVFGVPSMITALQRSRDIAYNYALKAGAANPGERGEAAGPVAFVGRDFGEAELGGVDSFQADRPDSCVVRLRRGNKEDYFLYTNAGLPGVKLWYPDELTDIGKLQGKRVLDAGTGGGRFVEDLRVAGVEAYGLDAFWNAEWAGKEAIFKQGLLERLPYPNDFFDVYYSQKSGYFYDPSGYDAFLREAMRVIKPGGSIRIGPFQQLEDLQALIATGEKIGLRLSSDYSYSHSSDGRLVIKWKGRPQGSVGFVEFVKPAG